MQWEGSLYIDTVLSFGLRSAPKIFNALADALEWILIRRHVPSVIHYLDDFLFVGRPHSQECAGALDTAISTCQGLGVPLAPEKVQGPASVITFLGIELDSEAQQLCLPQDKLEHIRSSLAVWGRKRACTKRELLSLIGVLQHTCRVVKPGRTFLR